MLELGILMLIATPFPRLMTALIGFLHERDAKFVAISLLVICIVMLGIVVKL